MILILAEVDDAVVRRALDWFAEREIDARSFDARRLPGADTLSLAWTPDGGRRRTGVFEGRALDFDDVGAVWHRRVLVGGGDLHADRTLGIFAYEETKSAVKQLWSDLDVPFVPAPWAHLQDEQSKLRQLTLAARVGFEIPPTLVTNDPKEFRSFYRAQSGRCIVKHITHVSMENSQLLQRYFNFTEPVTHRDLAASDSIRDCVTQVQGYVPKKLELRVTVVGTRVFAAEIDSQASQHCKHDYRRYDFANAPIREHRLPDAERERCLVLTRAMGLRYGAFDFILTPDDRYVFLEINPGGEYHWIEAYTGMPITESICELLRDLDRQTLSQRYSS